MSVLRCEGSGCVNQIDTDYDTECMVEVGNMRRLHKEIALCPKCRDRHEDEIGGMEPHDELPGAGLK